MKKLASGFILCLMLAGSGLVVHADSTDVNLKDNKPVKIEDEIEWDDEQASIELIKPEPDYMVTTNSTVVISGKGIKGTSVVLEVYGQEEKVIIEIKDEDEDDLDLMPDEEDSEIEEEEGKKSDDQDKKSDEDTVSKEQDEETGEDEGEISINQDKKSDEDEKSKDQQKEYDKDEDKKTDKDKKSNEKKKSKPKKLTKRLKKENFEIGSMGLFAKEVKLNLGENKIILRSKTDGTKIERIVNYKKIEEEDMKKSMDKIQEKGMTELINDICSQK